jgi:hypothetical protein
MNSIVLTMRRPGTALMLEVAHDCGGFPAREKMSVDVFLP